MLDEPPPSAEPALFLIGGARWPRDRLNATIPLVELRVRASDLTFRLRGPIIHFIGPSVVPRDKVAGVGLVRPFPPLGRGVEIILAHDDRWIFWTRKAEEVRKVLTAFGYPEPDPEKWSASL